LDDDDQQEADNLVDLKKMEVMQSGTEERKMGIKGWRRLKRIPQGNAENLSGARYAISSFFIDDSKYTMQLKWLISIPSPNSSISSFSTICYSRKPFLTEARTRFDMSQKIKK